jgi:hypothetical protein
VKRSTYEKLTDEPSGANKPDVQFETEHRRKAPVKRLESEFEANKVKVIDNFGDTAVWVTVTFREEVSTFVAFKLILESETRTVESVFNNIVGTRSTGVDKTMTDTFSTRLNAGWRKDTTNREPGWTDGTTTDANVLLCGDAKGEVATIPVNKALLARVSGSAKLVEDVNKPANRCSTVKKTESLATGFVFEYTFSRLIANA